MSIRAFFGGATFLAVLIAGLTALVAETSVSPEPGDLRAAGTVDFKVSGAPEVRPEFIRGVALLHSFFYEEARRIFTEVAAKDPNCAMAQWGIAMTLFTPLWPTRPSPADLQLGWDAAQKGRALAPPVSPRLAAPTSAGAVLISALLIMLADPSQS